MLLEFILGIANVGVELFYRPDALPVLQPAVSKHWIID